MEREGWEDDKDEWKRKMKRRKNVGRGRIEREETPKTDKLA